MYYAMMWYSTNMETLLPFTLQFGWHFIGSKFSFHRTALAHAALLLGDLIPLTYTI
jgi:hypothetical protein